MKRTESKNDKKAIEQKSPVLEAAFEETHWRARDLAKKWGLSPAAIRKMFRDEPGVILIGQKGSNSKRSYRVMLIPSSVAERVYLTLRASS
jgi:hypothetical protein